MGCGFLSHPIVVCVYFCYVASTRLGVVVVIRPQGQAPPLFYVALTELNVFILVVLLYLILLFCVVPSWLDTLCRVTPRGLICCGSTP